MGYIIGIDFDGTVVTHEYPDVGRDIGAVPVLKRLVNSGNKLILFTMRSSRNGTLQDAVNWFKDNGIELYGINTNPTQSEWTDSTKAHCNIYIDDAGLATPTKYDEESGREYVDWKRVEQILDRKFGAFEEEEKDFDDEEFDELFKRMFGNDEKNKKIDEQYKMQKNVVKINEVQLRNLIKENVKKSIGGYENQYADDKGNLIQSRKDGDGKKHWRTIKDQDYKKEKGGKFNKEEYSDVYGDEHGNHIQSRIDGNGKKHWKVDKKVDENTKMGSVKLTESQLHKLIKESVKKALVKEWRELTAPEKEWRDIEQEREDKKRAKENDDALEKSKFAKKMLGKKSGELDEISSDMISRAKKKFQQKYGWNGTERDKLEKDEHGNPLHPKDKKFIGDHLKNFSNAYNRAKYDEDMQNPLLRKAQEMYREVDLEQEVADWTDDYGCDVNLWGEIEDENGGVWKFEGWGAGVNVGGGDIEIDHVEEMNFESPDGQTGSVPRP